MIVQNYETKARNYEAQALLSKALRECREASKKKYDDFDCGALILASAHWHLRGHGRSPLLNYSTVEKWMNNSNQSLF